MHLNTQHTKEIIISLNSSTIERYYSPSSSLLCNSRMMSRSPEIVDSFNSLGKDEVNLHFIKGLYGLINGKKNLFVVVATQNKQVADALCGLNGGQRIAPIRGCYSGDCKTSPNWKEEKWGRSLLIEAIRYQFNDNESSEKFGDECKFDFISDDMTPLQATMAAARSLRRKRTPGSPSGCHSYATAIAVQAMDHND